MKSRERVLAALNHHEADRMPIDFGGHRSSGIAAIAYAKLRKSLGLAPRPIRVYDPIQQLAIIDEDVLDLFHVDTIELGRGICAGGRALGGLDAARRHALPDAALGRRPSGRRASGF